MEAPKMHSYEELLHMVRTLDQDNTRLRNNVIECNDEIFTLKAVAASVEAELRYSTEQELLKIGSELKFRSKELATLSKDHERVLKDLNSLKQNESNNKKLSQTTGTSIGLGLKQAGTVVTKPSLEEAADSAEMQDDFAFSQPAPPASARATSTTSNSSLHIKTNNIEANQVKSTADKGLGAVSPRPGSEQKLFTRAALLAVDRLRDAAEQRLQTIARDFELMLVFTRQGGGVGCEVAVQETVLAVTVALRTLSLVKVGSIVQFLEAALRLGETLLSSHTLTRGVATCLLSLQYLLCVLSAVAAELIALLPSSIQYQGATVESALHDVVGNLQNKFEKAATGTATAVAVKDDGGAKRTFPVATTVSESAKPQDLVLRALKTPAIKEADRRAALEASVHTVMSKRTEISIKEANIVLSCVGKYVSFLSSVLEFCSTQTVVQSGADSVAYQQLLQHCAWVGTEAFSQLQSHKEAGADDTLFDVVADSLSAAVRSLRTLLRHPEAAPLAMKSALAQYLGGAVGLSQRSFQVLVAQERLLVTQSDDTGILGILVKETVQPLTDSHANNRCRCQILLVLLQWLRRYRAEFVLLLLRVWPPSSSIMQEVYPPGAEVAASGKGKKRARTDAENDAASSSSSISSQPLGGAQGRASSRSQVNGGGAVNTTGNQVQVTPSHPSRQPGKTGIGRGDSIGASGANEGNRITPSSAGVSGGRSSSQRTSLRRRGGGGGQLDLRDRLPQVRRHLITLLAQFWMRLIRHLDYTPSQPPRLENEETALKVRMLHLLNALLSGVLDHLNHHDCEYILSDCTDVFHEYIYRCNTSSWNPVLKMPEALFGFLENRNNESAT